VQVKEKLIQYLVPHINGASADIGAAINHAKSSVLEDEELLDALIGQRLRVVFADHLRRMSAKSSARSWGYQADMFGETLHAYYPVATMSGTPEWKALITLTKKEFEEVEASIEVQRDSLSQHLADLHKLKKTCMELWERDPRFTVAQCLGKPMDTQKP